MATASSSTGQRQPNRGVESDGPIVDPTKNVLDLVEAANKRQDDLRVLMKELSDTKIAHQKEMSDVRERHQRELDHAESERLDSIRQVDREDVNKTAAQALSAIQTLAATTNTTAETLRTQVATTATATANQLTTITGEINKRLSALELSASGERGKQTVSDPAMAELVAEMRKQSLGSERRAGQSTGMNATFVAIAMAISMLVGLIALGTFVFVTQRQPAPAPQIIYTPAPPGTQLPSSPPATVPR